MRVDQKRRWTEHDQEGTWIDGGEGGTKVKVERDWSTQRYGQGDRSGFKCYKCGEAGHMWKNCPKTAVKRVEVLLDEEGKTLLMAGVINGQEELCEMDTGAETCMIPERLAGGLEVTGKAECKPVGFKFVANSVMVRVKVGCIDREVMAAVTPDSFISHPLIGRNAGVDDLLQCAIQIRELQQKNTRVEMHAVKTRAMTAKEEKQAEVTRKEEKVVITKPEELEQVHTLMGPDAVAADNTPQDTNGEPLAVVNKKVDPELNIGLVIPSMELGASLGAEYKGAMESDETLRESNGWGSARSKGFLWDNGVLKRVVEDEISGSREVVVIPVGLRLCMLGLVHDYLGHVGSGKMAWMLKQSCCWPGLSGDAKRYGKACVECQRMRKGGLAEVPMGEMPIHKTLFENVAIDIVGPFPRSHGFKYILTYICLASRYPEAIPLRQATAQECAEALLEIFSQNGVLITLLSDQGTQFMGVLMRKLCERLGIKQIRTTPYHPQSNGAVERMHGTLVPMLRKLVKKDLPWDSQLKFALFAIRATPNRSTGYAPFQIIHGKVLRSPLDVVLHEIDPVQSQNVKAVEWLEELSRRVSKIREEVETNVGNAQSERKERHDKQAVVRRFEVGNKVLTRVLGLKSKLEGSWEGPFVVLDVPSEC